LRFDRNPACIRPRVVPVRPTPWEFIVKKEEFEAIFAEAGETPDLGPIGPYLLELATARELPRLALGMCAVRFEESSPALRVLLARAADGEALSDDEVTLLFRGLHILGAARIQAAWPDLLRLLRLPVDTLEDLLGDVLTETLPRIITGMFNGDADGLLGGIADLRLNESVREAFWKAATFLAWEGRIERDRMRQFIVRFYEERLAKDWDLAWIGWIDAIAYLGLEDLAPLVERAWNERRVPPGVMEYRDFREDLDRARRSPDDDWRFTNAGMGYIEDVVESLEWTCEDPDEDDDEWDDEVWDDEDWENPPNALSVREDPPDAPSEPAINPWRDVGRNDPCPCGSGKKFKRCCLGKLK
jgi:uncharacterized protein